MDKKIENQINDMWIGVIQNPPHAIHLTRLTQPESSWAGSLFDSVGSRLVIWKPNFFGLIYHLWICLRICGSVIHSVNCMIAIFLKTRHPTDHMKVRCHQF